ncbi:MAG: hypothetical protein LBC02_14365 [Planctomycetaceae bacterium]|nr:hypothetical protein [Planctomycetaceae bacterium]
MSYYHIESLWSQAGGEQIIGAIIFLLLVVAQILKAYFDARSARIGEEKNKPAQKSARKLTVEEQLDLDDPFSQTFSQTQVQASQTAQTKPHRERKRATRKQSLATETIAETTRKTRGTLSRELAPQGEGTRFETATGTFDPSQIVAPTIEPTVKPTLESMTGIYEALPTSSELQPQLLTFDVHKLIASPEGIRQAVLLSEILKRPNF